MQITLKICSLTTMTAEVPSLFSNLSENIKSVASKSRLYSKNNEDFNDLEIQIVLKKE